LVPLHPSSRAAVKHYAALRDRVFPRPKDTRFFVSERGTRLSGSYVHTIFLRLSRRIGLRSPTALHGPRIHDLRQHADSRIMPNSFQIHRLEGLGPCFDSA
jgi:integrase